MMKEYREIEKILDKLLELSVENEVVEFKKAEKQYDKDKIGRYFSALSNEANLKGVNNAWLIFGVSDNLDIVGTKISDKQLNEYKVEVSNHTTPKCTFTNVYRVERENKSVILFEIPPTKKGFPMAWKGHRYGRNGESLGALNDFEYEKIKNQLNKDDWSIKIVKKASVDDLSKEAIQKAREEFTKKNKDEVFADEIPLWDDMTFLNKAKVCINGKITRTAILLLGKPESEHFISPATSKISWILKDKDNIEKDYAHFSCPLILQVDELKSKIRNLKYRYIKDGTLFPDEVNQYDSYTIREALNNCIAHQDYTMGGKINVVENEDGFLIFQNSGTFIPGSVEKVIEADAPQEHYRNQFLANAMVNLGMIDTIGSGIKRLFTIQKNKYFPLPDYDFSDEKIKVKIIGKVVDVNYARKLAEIKDLSLQEIILLDKVAKRKKITKEEAEQLKNKDLIEGRRPNYIIASSVANVVGEKAKYIKQRGMNNAYYKQMIVSYLTEFKEGAKSDFETLLIDKLPDILSIAQKKNKIKNILQAMKQKGIIEPRGKKWIMSKHKK